MKQIKYPEHKSITLCNFDGNGPGDHYEVGKNGVTKITMNPIADCFFLVRRRKPDDFWVQTKNGRWGVNRKYSGWKKVSPNIIENAYVATIESLAAIDGISQWPDFDESGKPRSEEETKK